MKKSERVLRELLVRFTPLWGQAVFLGGRSRAEPLSTPAVARLMQPRKDRAGIGQQAQAVAGKSTDIECLHRRSNAVPACT